MSIKLACPVKSRAGNVCICCREEFKMNKNICAIVAFSLLLFSRAAICGENIWTTNGPPGATVYCIEVRPDDPNVVYAGTTQDGIYRSTDGGETWAKFGEGLIRETMLSIACHPFAPDTMYCSAVYGMYKSIDAGAHWQLMYPPYGELNDYRAIAIHPSLPNIILAGGTNNAWKSTDRGDTWTLMALPGEYGLEDIEFSLTEPNVVYLATQSNIFGKAVYKSTDTGDTWVNMHNNLDSATASSDIEVDPSSAQVVYLSGWDHADNSPGRFIWKSTDGGETWFDVSPQVSNGYGAMEVIVSPDNPNEIWACTVFDGVYRSHNGGQTWSPFNDSLQTLETATIRYDPITGRICLGVFYDGIYKLSPNSQRWIKIGYDFHLSACKRLSVNYHDSEELVVPANNGPFLSSDMGESWTWSNFDIPIGEGPAAIMYDKYLSSIRYLSTFNRGNNEPRIGFYVSTDFGETWESRSNGLPDYPYFYDMDISFIDSASRRIFIATTEGLFFSDDMGALWQEATSGLPVLNFFTAIEVSEDDPYSIALGDRYNTVYLSSDCGTSWAQATLPPRLLDEYIDDIEFDPFDTDVIYVTSWPIALFKSEDRGQSWHDISSNLPRDTSYFGYLYLFISDILVNPHNPSNLFAAISNHGVYQTNDGGLFWESFSEGLDPVAASGTLSFSLQDTTRLYIATSGRGVWSIHRTITGVEDEAPTLPVELSISPYPNPFNSSMTLNYSLPKTGPVSISIHNILGQHVETIFIGQKDAGNYTLQWDASDLPSGLYFARLIAGEKTETTKMLLLK
jgi:photosystem II stability/assembly factor-like uncharacterized protein